MLLFWKVSLLVCWELVVLEKLFCCGWWWVLILSTVVVFFDEFQMPWVFLIGIVGGLVLEDQVKGDVPVGGVHVSVEFLATGAHGEIDGAFVPVQVFFAASDEGIAVGVGPFLQSEENHVGKLGIIGGGEIAGGEASGDRSEEKRAALHGW